MLSCALASSWAIMLSSILLLATYELGSLWLADMSRAKEARRLGAKFLPRVKGRLPGNLDHLWDAVFNWPSDYIGHPVARLTQQYGSTFHLRILSEDCVSFVCSSRMYMLLIDIFLNRYSLATLHTFDSCWFQKLLTMKRVRLPCISFQVLDSMIELIRRNIWVCDSQLHRYVFIHIVYPCPLSSTMPYLFSGDSTFSSDGHVW